MGVKMVFNYSRKWCQEANERQGGRNCMGMTKFLYLSDERHIDAKWDIQSADHTIFLKR